MRAGCGKLVVLGVTVSPGLVQLFHPPLVKLFHPILKILKPYTQIQRFPARFARQRAGRAAVTRVAIRLALALALFCEGCALALPTSPNEGDVQSRFHWQSAVTIALGFIVLVIHAWLRRRIHAHLKNPGFRWRGRMFAREADAGLLLSMRAGPWHLELWRGCCPLEPVPAPEWEAYT